MDRRLPEVRCACSRNVLMLMVEGFQRKLRNFSKTAETIFRHWAPSTLNTSPAAVPADKGMSGDCFIGKRAEAEGRGRPLGFTQ